MISLPGQHPDTETGGKVAVPDISSPATVTSPCSKLRSAPMAIPSRACASDRSTSCAGEIRRNYHSARAHGREASTGKLGDKRHKVCEFRSPLSTVTALGCGLCRGGVTVAQVRWPLTGRDGVERAFE